jgi:hypothetical protein
VQTHLGQSEPGKGRYRKPNQLYEALTSESAKDSDRHEGNTEKQETRTNADAEISCGRISVPAAYGADPLAGATTDSWYRRATPL